MCEFVSWIEKDGKTYFLQDSDMNSPEGENLTEYLKHEYCEDICGHGAIKRYFKRIGSNLDYRGIDHESSDFSSPKNFPKEIAKAIKQCNMTLIGRPDYPDQLLLGPACREFLKKERELDELFANIRDTLSQRLKNVTEYGIARSYLHMLRRKEEANAFWQIFKNKKNRKKVWR